MNEDAIPSQPGAYAIILRLERPVYLRIGRLGVAEFPAADYAYTGSAFGPGGLRARLGRHLHGNGRSHWHIDRLRAVTRVVAYTYAVAPLPERQECHWAQRLSADPKAFIPLPGFGASDCTFGCPAHLVGFPHEGWDLRVLENISR